MKNRVNLLLPKEQNVSGKIIYFALHYLRYILIITQLCVIGVFFYRFKIDQQIIDLKDELEQKREIVIVSDPMIKEAEAIDIKINAIGSILDKQEVTKKMLTYFFSIFPKKLTLDKLEAVGDTIIVTGIAEDPQILNIQRTVTGYKFLFDLSSFK